MIAQDFTSVYTITCDKCGIRSWWRPTRRGLIARLKRDGWRVFRGKDLTTDRWRRRHWCPACAQARKGE